MVKLCINFVYQNLKCKFMRILKSGLKTFVTLETSREKEEYLPSSPVYIVMKSFTFITKQRIQRTVLDPICDKNDLKDLI